MIGEVARAEEALLLAGVPDEEDRALRLHLALRERLGDLEHRHRPGAVVVGAVVDRVAARGPQRVKRVDVHVNRRHARLHARDARPRSAAPRSGSPSRTSAAGCTGAASRGPRPRSRDTRCDRCARRPRRTRRAASDPRPAGSPRRCASAPPAPCSADCRGSSRPSRPPSGSRPAPPRSFCAAPDVTISVTSADGAFGAGGSVIVAERPVARAAGDERGSADERDRRGARERILRRDAERARPRAASAPPASPPPAPP